MKDEYFWEEMENFSSQKNKIPITKDQLEILYDTLLDLHDDDIWYAGNFVKICGHLKSCTIGDVARALLDLKKNNFNYEDTIAQEKTPRYPPSNMNGGSEEMQAFLMGHFSDLALSQKIKLEFLKPSFEPSLS